MKLQEDKHYLVKKSGMIQKVFVNEITNKAYNIQAMDGHSIGWIQKEAFDHEYDVLEEIDQFLSAK